MTHRRHYSFAHEILPGLAFKEPLRLICVLASVDAVAALEGMWRRLGEIWEKGGRGEAVEPTGMAVEAMFLAERGTVLITLPEPKYPAEAFYVAIVLPP